MKLGLFLIAVSLSLIANAQQPVEATTIAAPPQVSEPPQPVETATSAIPQQASEIEKFSYIPPLRTTFMNAGFSHGTSKGSVTGFAGTVSDFKRTYTYFNYLFGYGVSDYLAVGLQGRILITSHSEYDYGPGSTSNGTSSSFKYSGWEEPALGGTWRIRDNTESKMRAHVNAAVRPMLQKAKVATTTTDGNAGIGGTQFNFGFSLFKEVKGVELQLSVQRNFLTVSKFENARDSSRTIEDDDYQTLSIRIGALGLTSDRFSIGGNIVLFTEEKRSSHSFTNNVKTGTVDIGTGNTSTLELIGKIKADESSLLQITIESLLNSTQSAKSGNSKLDRKNDSGTAVSLGWIQEF